MAMMCPDRVMIPMAPTFCLRSVFCTPAKMAPAAVVCSVVVTVLDSVSCGTYSRSAMVGRTEGRTLLELNGYARDGRRRR